MRKKSKDLGNWPTIFKSALDQGPALDLSLTAITVKL
jgi:hypothetical protein